MSYNTVDYRKICNKYVKIFNSNEFIKFYLKSNQLNNFNDVKLVVFFDIIEVYVDNHIFKGLNIEQFLELIKKFKEHNRTNKLKYILNGN